MRPVTLDGVDATELAELLAFTADALGWRAADVIRADLAAHLRRWAIQLHPVVRLSDGNGQHAGGPPLRHPAATKPGRLADSS